MTHLPECRLAHKCHGLTGADGEHAMKMDYCVACRRPCICEELRACEQRVSAKKDEIIGLTAFHSYEKGYNDALEEAEEAINKAPTTSNLMITLQNALAAIRALREEK